MENILLKICGISVLCVAVILVIRELRGSFSWGVRVGGIILIAGMIAADVGGILDEASSFLGGSRISEYTSVMLKALGVSFLVKICSDICRESGEGGIAFGVESAGKLCILYMCFPFIRDVIKYAEEFLRLGEL